MAAGSRADDKTDRRYEPMSLLFLQRLDRLVRLQRRYSGSELERQGWHYQALSRAIFSTYEDCLRAGLEEEAKQVLAGTWQAPASAIEEDPATSDSADR